MRFPLSVQLILYFLLLSISSIFIVGKFSYLKTKEALISRTFDQLISIRTEKEKRVLDFFTQCKNDLINISDLDASKKILSDISSYKNDNSSENILSKYLIGYLQANRRYKKIIFIDSSKQVLLFNIKQNTPDYKADFNCYSNIFNLVIKENKIIIDEVLINKKYTIIIAKPVFSAQNKFLGIIILEISYQPIDNIMFENNIHNGLGRTGEVYLVGEDFLMRSSSRFIKNSKFLTKVETIGVKNALNNKIGKGIINDYRGVKVFSSYKKLNIDRINWVILAEIDKKEAMQPINNVENNIIYLSIVISLLLLGIIAALSTNITSPIRKLQAETEKIYNGDYGHILDLQCNNEIGDLIIAFNKMSLQLKEQKDKLDYEQVIRTSYVINAQEAERQRLSRELHDGLAQYILAIKLKLEYALTLKGEEQNKIIRETKNLFAETIQEIRNISNDLMPSVLNEYGLNKAIENLISTLKQETKIEFIFKSDFSDNLLNKTSQIYIFRIIQEALNNTIKHANASKFIVSFNQKDSNLDIEISDNGRGVDFKNNLQKNGNGLANIKERVSLLSGKIKIVSSFNNGFLIKITLPL